MKPFQTLVLALSLAVLTACASQANKTHEVFSRDDADYQLLAESLEDLKIAVESGSGDTQYRAVVALRHISKFNQDPGKREMAVQGLVALVAFGGDNQVTKRGKSRLEWIFNKGSRALQVAVIHAERDLVTGDLGITERDTSLFSDHVELEYQLADDGEREDAVSFMVDLFEEGDAFQRYHLAQAFGTILANPKRCYEWDKAEGKVATPSGDASADVAPAKTGGETTASGFVCDEWDNEDQESWKEDLLSDIVDLLEEPDLSPSSAAALLLAMQGAKLDNPRTLIETLQDLSESSSLSDERRLRVEAALAQAQNLHEAIFTASFRKKRTPLSQGKR